MKKLILALCLLCLALPVGAMDITELPTLHEPDGLIDFSETSMADLTLSLDLATSFTFGEGGQEIEITFEDFDSMTLEETQNFLLLVMVCVNVQWLDMKLINIWGKKLLPRFFNKEVK